MVSYQKLLNEFIQNDSRFWNYYGIDIDGFNQIIDQPLNFIDRLFERAQKTRLTPFFGDGIYKSARSYLTNARAAHSISAFFLGAMIGQRMFGLSFSGLYSRPVSDRREDGGDFFEFPYIWTLTCLFHDYGYFYENSMDPANIINRGAYRRLHPNFYIQKTRSNWMIAFIQNEQIKYTIWQRNRVNRRVPNYSHAERHSERSSLGKILYDAYCEMPRVLYFPNDERKIQTVTRSRKVIEQYFALQLCDPPEGIEPHIEHGIAGGLLFFDRIIKNYGDNYEVKTNFYHEAANIEDFDILGYDGNRLRLCYDQFPLFAYIANTIINHNIWQPDSNPQSIQKYQDYGLESLLENKYDKIRFWNNPLLFILAIADSIEPYKLFSPSIYCRNVC